MARPLLPDKLNICLIARHFPIVGRAAGFSFLRLIAKGMASRGHSVTVLTAEDPLGRSEVEQDGVKIYFLLESR